MSLIPPAARCLTLPLASGSIPQESAPAPAPDGLASATLAPVAESTPARAPKAPAPGMSASTPDRHASATQSSSLPPPGESTPAQAPKAPPSSATASARASPPPPPRDCDVIAPNLKFRPSGVTASVARLTPMQAREIRIAATGFGLPREVPKISLWKLFAMKRRSRVWHARRNNEMLLGVALRDLLGMKLKLMFTSASRRRHTRYTRWLLSRMDAIVAVSSESASWLEWMEKGCEVIPHGIDSNRFRPCADKRALRERLGLPHGTLIGCYGRIRPAKGTDAFVDAMIELLPDFPDCFALAVGRATSPHAAFLRDLRERVAKAGLEERILFLPEVPVGEVCEWHCALDLFVAPSLLEGFGLAPLEAMACGVPVVASRVGALEGESPPKGAASLVSPGDSVALCGAIRSWLSDSRRLREAPAAARAYALERFPLEREANALNRLYARLLESPTSESRRSAR